MIKKSDILKRYICPLLLLLLPLRHIAQGIDISDTGYNLACFVWFGKADGMWVYVTYLANMAGHLFTLLPFGDTMLGMNVYCSLVVSITVLLAWYFLQSKLPFWILFAGEVLAILLCWCPQVILYNYLTYLGLLLGTIFLYKGICTQKKGWLLLAGLVLGLGVGVRFSNLTHTALITALWYDGFLQKKRFRQVLMDTLWCICGYVAGALSFLLMIQLQYGLDGYFTMLFGLQSMSSKASGYSTVEMLTGAFVDYIGSMKWGALFLLYLGAGLLLFTIKKGSLEWVKRVVFVAGFCILLRLVYGRGMFGFDYNTYFSIFWWVSLFNLTALLCSLFVLLHKSAGVMEKRLAMLVLVTILILPLGSNNRSYPVINNLFLIAPVTLFFLYRFLPRRFPVQALTLGCLLVLFVQSAGFGMTFVFRDGSYAEKRDTKIENNGILRGMYTTRAGAESLEEVIAFWEQRNYGETPVILYGDIPGLSYILHAPSAITSTWSNLESYNMTFWNRDFAAVEKEMDRVRPIVLIGQSYVPTDEKGELLQEFLEKYNYQTVFENSRVKIYH